MEIAIADRGIADASKMRSGETIIVSAVPRSEWSEYTQQVIQNDVTITVFKLPCTVPSTFDPLEIERLSEINGKKVNMGELPGLSVYGANRAEIELESGYVYDAFAIGKQVGYKRARVIGASERISGVVGRQPKYMTFEEMKYLGLEAVGVNVSIADGFMAKVHTAPAADGRGFEVRFEYDEPLKEFYTRIGNMFRHLNVARKDARGWLQP